MNELLTNETYSYPRDVTDNELIALILMVQVVEKHVAIADEDQCERIFAYLHKRYGKKEQT